MAKKAIYGWLALLLLAAPALGVDDSAPALNLNVELRYGPVGPTRPPEVTPRDKVCFTTVINGLEIRDGLLNLRYQYEILSKDDQILLVVDTGQRKFRPLLAKDSAVLNGVFQLPSDFTIEEIKLRVAVKDLHSGVEVTERLPIKVSYPQGPHPTTVTYYASREGKFPRPSRFTLGEDLIVGFHIAQVHTASSYQYKLLFIPRGESEPIRVIESQVMTSAQSPLAPTIPQIISLSADAPFEGICRIQIEDNQGRINSLDLPLTITANEAEVEAESKED